MRFCGTWDNPIQKCQITNDFIENWDQSFKNTKNLVLASGGGFIILWTGIGYFWRGFNLHKNNTEYYITGDQVAKQENVQKILKIETITGGLYQEEKLS